MCWRCTVFETLAYLFKSEFLIPEVFALQLCSNFTSYLPCYKNESPLTSVRQVWGQVRHYQNLTFLFPVDFCGEIFLVLVVLPRERPAHHRRLTTSAALQGRSVPTFHEGCLPETPSTSASREGHGISKAHRITLLRPRLPCLMAPASSGDHPPQASSASSPPSLCAGENERRSADAVCLPRALGDWGTGVGWKVYKVAG